MDQRLSASQPPSPVSRVRAHVYTREIRQHSGLKGEREREKGGTVSGWHYIVGLAARGKLGGQSFDRLFGKQGPRLRANCMGTRSIPYLPFANVPPSPLTAVVTIGNNS